MIIVAVSHRNRQRRRAMASALTRRGTEPHQIRGHFTALSNYLRDAHPAALDPLGLIDHDDHALLTYVTDRSHTGRGAAGAGEKVDLVGYRHVTPVFERARAEMLALLGRARRTDPIEHYVISWGDDEHPTPAQVEQAVQMLMQIQGLEEHQAIYAAHSNTLHYHVHVAVNRVHPEAGTLVAAGDGWQLNAAQQAAAWIEHRQGWAARSDTIYEVDTSGVRHVDSKRLVRRADGSATGLHPPDRREQGKPLEDRLSRSARGYERRTGMESFERIAMTVAAPIIAGALSWEELHAELGKEGLGYQRYGTSGAWITMGDRAVSASLATRDAAITQMESADKLGPFVPGNPAWIIPRIPHYRPGQEFRAAYEDARAGHAAAVAAARERINAERAYASETIIAWRRSFAAEINAGDWRGRRDQLNAVRQLFAMHFQAIERELMATTGPVLAGLRAAMRFPSYDAWRGGVGASSISLALDLAVPLMIAPSGDHAATGIPIAGYEQRRQDAACCYQRVNRVDPAFTDHGPLLAIHTLEHADVTAALNLAQRKWGSVELISGSDAFLRLAVEIAAREKIALTGKLAERCKRAMQRIVATHQMPTPPLSTLAARATDTSTSTAGMRSHNTHYVALPTTAPAFQSLPPACDGMRGGHPLIDAWLNAWQRDPNAMATLRPLAAAVTADRKARDLVEQWLAKGSPAAARLRQHATDHTRMLRAAQAKARVLGFKVR